MILDRILRFLFYAYYIQPIVNYNNFERFFTLSRIDQKLFGFIQPIEKTSIFLNNQFSLNHNFKAHVIPIH